MVLMTYKGEKGGQADDDADELHVEGIEDTESLR